MCNLPHNLEIIFFISLILILLRTVLLGPLILFIRMVKFFNNELAIFYIDNSEQP